MKTINTTTAFILLLISSLAFGDFAQAQSGWIKVAENTDGDGFYIKNVRCGGPICEFDFTPTSSNPYNTGMQVNCNNWTARFRHVTGPKKGTFMGAEWDTISPTTTHNSAAEYVCR